MQISEETKRSIIKGAEGHLHEYISDFIDLRKSGKDLVGKCPRCNSDKKLYVSPSKQLFKCFKCDWGGNSMITFMMEGLNKSYIETLKYLAEKQGIFLTDEPVKQSSRRSKKDSLSFCDLQLFASGLNYDDVRIKAIKSDANSTTTHISPFQKGGIDQYGRLDLSIDDMLIWYYDLDGNPVTWRNERKKKDEHFFRVRFSNPALHLDKDGKPMKYKSPAGSGTHIYIPERIRELYSSKSDIPRLYIQEGEKKAEKACKHGIPSIGIMGIHNIAFNGALPADLQRIISNCNVQEVVFCVDADWDHISENLKVGERADLRPRTFFYAVKNFRDYMKTFTNVGIYIETYFAHLIGNEKQEKGIDDLLAGSLKNKEHELIEDIQQQINSKEGKGKYIQLYKISTWSDFKLEELWSLQTAQTFSERYKDILEKIPEFRIGKHKWRFVEGKLESAQPLNENEQFWQTEEWTDRSGRDRRLLSFDYANCYTFLKNRGFGRIKMADGDPHLAHVNGHVVINVQAYEIKDYVIDFIKQLDMKDVLNMLYKGGFQYLGPQRMQELDFVNPEFGKSRKDRQYLYFRKDINNIDVWDITANGIKLKKINEIDHYIWSDEIIELPIEFSDKELLKVEKIDEEYLKSLPKNEVSKYEQYLGYFDVQISPEGEKCHFLQFLHNASNFHWRKMQKNEPLTIDDIAENAMHLMAKLTAIGYLLHSYKDASISRAVILMDGKQSEVGTSNGRTGKSLMGKAIEFIIPQHYIGAKGKNLTDDQFIFDGLTEKHRNLFLDDVRANVDFEFFFPLITGKLMVNQKGGKRFTLSFEQTPKLLISSNHAINGEGSSFSDRQWLVAFSDYYSDEHKPLDDFGIAFFSDWDFEQWNLFYRLMATCIRLYLKYGVIESPHDRLEQRRLRQAMGEDFLTWAEEYFSESGPNINRRKERKEIYESFLSDYPHLRKYVTPTHFKRKVKAYCTWKGYKFNPQRFDPQTGEPLYHDKDGRADIEDKRGGKEYFTIGNKDFDIELFNKQEEIL